MSDGADDAVSSSTTATGTSPPTDTPEVAPIVDPDDTARSSVGGLAGRLGLFFVLTLVLAYPEPWRLGRSIPGNPGDANLVMVVLKWGADRLPRGFRGYADGPFFAAGHDVMAYSDTLLPLVPVFWLIETATGSAVVAFNVLYLASWVICAEATFRLARRLIRNEPASIVAAIAFTFSTIRLSQSGHFQLAWAGFVPLAVLLVFRLRDRPTVTRGALVGLVVVVQFLTSAYYGIVLVPFAAACIGSFAIGTWRSGERRTFLPAVGGFASVLVALMAPIAWWYTSATDRAAARPDEYSVHALRLGDLRSPAPSSTLLREIPVLDGDIVGRSSERYAYVGVLVLVFVPVLAWLVATGRHRWRELFSPRAEWVAVVALGVVAALVSVGSEPVLGIVLPFHDVALAIVPGFDSVRALVRLVVFAQLAAVLLAGAAIAVLLDRVRSDRLRFGVAALLVVVVAVEGLQDHELLDVVEPQPGSVHSAMEQLEPGVVALLPMAPPEVWPESVFLESTRMVLGVDDDLQSLNGYSGRQPEGYAGWIPVINEFPSPAALDLLADLDVRYVVLYTAPIDTGADRYTALVNDSGLAYFEPGELDRRLAALPAAVVAGRIDRPDGIIIELAGGRDGER